MSDQPPSSRDHASATGQEFTEAKFLDTHFETCRIEYEAIVRSVGIQPGWHILDAGCGSGGFVPLLAELVGPSGHVTAIDLAPDNIIAIRERLAIWHLPCPVTAEMATFTVLPFPDDTFDGVWCANTLMYLTDDELATALAEFGRVVRPSGRLMVKEIDLRLCTDFPGDPGLWWRVWDAQDRNNSPQQGAIRSRGLHTLMKRAGFTDVSQRTVLVELYAPLSPVARQFLGDVLAYHATCAEELGMPEADLAAWRAISDPASSSYQLDQPDYCRCEAQVVAVGSVPRRADI